MEDLVRVVEAVSVIVSVVASLVARHKANRADGRARDAQALADGAFTKAHEAQRINLALAEQLPATKKRAVFGDARGG